MPPPLLPIVLGSVVPTQRASSSPSGEPDTTSPLPCEDLVYTKCHPGKLVLIKRECHEHPLGSKHCMFTDSLNPHHSPSMEALLVPHFTGGETEA